VQLTASIIPLLHVVTDVSKESDVPTVLIGVQGTALLMLLSGVLLSVDWVKKLFILMGRH